MKVLVIVAHPDLEKSKVNKRWVEELNKNKKITVNNLYEKYPNSVIDVKAEQKLLTKHDRIVFQFPLQWYNIPPILREWQDKVLEHGWAYGIEYGAVEGKEFIAAVAISAPKSSYQSGGYNRFTMSEILRPLEATSNLLGMRYLPSFNLFSTVGLNENEIDQSAKEYVSYILDEDLNPDIHIDRYKHLLNRFL